jgi:DNA polymerase delta subunit 1
MLENILDLLLCKNDIEGISIYVKKIIGNLVQNKIDISKLVITKAISKSTEEE